MTKTWLDKNPNEVVEIFLENPAEFDGDYALWKVFEDLDMNDMLIERNSDGSWPTMKASIAAGKRIVVYKMAGCDATDDGVRSAGTSNPGQVKNTMYKIDDKDTFYDCPSGFLKAFDNSYDTNYE